MPMIRNRYPPNWEEITLARKIAANWTCQGCGRPCRLPGESNEDLIERIESEHPEWAGDLREWELDDEQGAIESGLGSSRCFSDPLASPPTPARSRLFVPRDRDR